MNLRSQIDEFENFRHDRLCTLTAQTVVAGEFPTAAFCAMWSNLHNRLLPYVPTARKTLTKRLKGFYSVIKFA